MARKLIRGETARQFHVRWAGRRCAVGAAPEDALRRLLATVRLAGLTGRDAPPSYVSRR